MKPLVSIIMPTYNSEKTIGIALQAIADQTYKNIEILVIDGGSNDNTISIAKNFGAKKIDNPKKLPEYAKHIGLLQANGKYGVFLDSDEQMLSPESIEKKVKLLETHQEVKNIATGGLLNPKSYGDINGYINSIGDPFSYYMYGNDGSDYISSMRRKFSVDFEDEESIIFKFGKNDVPPINDGGGHFFDLEFLKKTVDINDISVVTQVFSALEEKTHRLAVIKNDFINHYSTSSLKGYLKKIDRRVINNIHHASSSPVGYSSREKSYPKIFGVKKILFLPYAFTLVGPIFDSLKLVKKNKNSFYFNHIWLVPYTAGKITFEMGKKLLGKKTKISAYGK